MKKIYIISIVTILFSLLLLSCDDFLDAEPKDKIGSKMFWKSGDNARSYVTSVYNFSLPSSYDNNPIFEEAMSDNCYLRWEGWFTNIKLVANGTQSSYNSAPFNIWSSSYQTIRSCWLFLENIEQTEMSADEKEELTGQIRFFLAYSYSRLITYFGDVPLVTKTLSVEESLTVPRSPKADVLNLTIEQIDLAIRDLKGKNLTRGRVTEGACMALKARVYLHQNDFDNVLKVTEKLIGKYSLNTAGDTPYADLFNGVAEKSNEIIFSREYMHKTTSVSTGNIYNQCFFVKGMSGGDALGAAMTPTGSMIDSYPMIDGRLIHEAGSTYVPSDPYKNRDPRLAQSVIYPTSLIRAVQPDGIKDVLYDPENSSTIAAQQYNAKEPSTTGYMWKKYVDWSDHAMVQITDCGVDLIYFRYADVLLMHAEALIETKAEAAKTEVIDIIDQLRTRCKGGLVHRENYNSKEEIRDLLRNERRIELANEGLRYFDIIRWKIAEAVNTEKGYGLNGELYGAYMRLDGVGKNDRVVMIDGVARRYSEETRIFNPAKHYLQPIPQKDIDLTKGILTQNPNW